MNEAELWLKAWHDRRPGATSRAFHGARPSTYEWLAALARPQDRVLDLACGDGFLMELLIARGAVATGVDMSPGELSAARARLGDRATLVEARAQALPFADASFDLVTCHLALMLMNPVDEVVSEVRRVLREGGRLGAVVNRPDHPADDAWARFGRHLKSLEFSGPAVGDPRTYAEEGLREILGKLAELRIQPWTVDIPLTPDQAWSLLMETYPFDMLDTEQQLSLEKAMRAEFQQLLRPDGTVPFSMELWMISGVR